MSDVQHSASPVAGHVETEGEAAVAEEVGPPRDLLRRVVEVAPKDWQAEALLGHCVAFWHPGECLTVTLDFTRPPILNAMAAELMLDEIEHRGYLPEIYAGHVDGDDSEPITYCCSAFLRGSETVFDSGTCATRAAAVAEAFVAILEAERGQS